MTIDYQALREAAQNAKDLGGIKNYKRGEQAVAEFESLITPHIVLALLDERERNQQYIKRRDQENEEIALTVGRLLIENGQLVADTLRHLADNEIDSDYFAITSTNENGTEIDHEMAITDYALQAAGTVDELVAALESAEKRIAELEAEPVSQTYKLNELSGNSPVTPDGWISCSDRIPEDTKMLLAFSQGEIVAAYWNWVVNPIDYKKYRAFTYLSGNILDDVTHWMPLPEPPQEVNRG
ncbi:TPA: DUF551 domain-containing protein [Escherichia coli]|nr:DUF551 domain-containing protein [Escherichia coli]HAN7006889.1 DUF551 domain-containing protein [Escherichia coli]